MFFQNVTDSCCNRCKVELKVGIMRYLCLLSTRNLEIGDWQSWRRHALRQFRRGHR